MTRNQKQDITGNQGLRFRPAHLIDVFGLPTASHFSGPLANQPVAGYCGTAEGAPRQLDEAHDAWVGDLCSLGEAGLVRPQGDISPPQYADVPMARRIMHIHREAIHHGAEIALLRDLYLWKGGQDGL